MPVPRFTFNSSLLLAYVHFARQLTSHRQRLRALAGQFCLTRASICGTSDQRVCTSCQQSRILRATVDQPGLTFPAIINVANSSALDRTHLYKPAFLAMIWFCLVYQLRNLGQDSLLLPFNSYQTPATLQVTNSVLTGSPQDR